VAQIRERPEAHEPAPAAPAAPVARAPSAAAAVLPERRGPPWRSPRAAALLVITLAVAGWIAGESWRRLRPDLVTAGGVAVFPFSFSGSSASAHLSHGVADLISANLTDAAALHSIDPRAVAAAAARVPELELTRRRAERIARDLGARTYLVGSIAEAGGRLRLTATLNEIGQFGRANSATVEGPSSELFALADRLTAELLARRLSDGADPGVGSASRTTSSPQALQAYTEGEAAYRAGRFPAAVDALQRAVDADSTFALAYLRLSNAAHWTGAGQLASRAAARAVALAGRLAPRDRSHVAAWAVFQSGAVSAAQRAYRAILAQDSADTEAWQQLGEIGFHWGPNVGRAVVLSRPEWERTLALSPQNLTALVHLARIEAAENRRRPFEELAARIEALGPGGQVTAELRLLQAFAFGDAAARAAAVRRAEEVPPSVRRDIVFHAAFAAPGSAEPLGPLLYSTGFLGREAGMMAVHASFALVRGRLAAAEVMFDSAMLLEPNRIVDFRAMVQSLPLLGSAAGRRALLPLVDAPPSGVGASHDLAVPWRLFARAMMAHGDGDAAKALAAETALAALERAPNPNTAGVARDFGRVLAAARLRSAGRAREALERLGPAVLDGLHRVWDQANAYERLLRGELLYELGRPDEALPWFASFPDPTCYDMPFLPVALLWQLRIQKELGRAPEAEALRRRIAALFAGADPPLNRPADQLLALLSRPQAPPVTATGNREVSSR
jgi:tetratricopeptide (TPR) repeat protein